MDKKQTQTKKKARGKKQRIGRPNLFFYHLAMLVLRPYYYLRYGVRVDRRALRGIRGPALILAPHISGKDHVLVGIALFPHRPTFVMSQHFFAFPVLGWFLKRMHAIGKRMFSSDAKTILQVLRAKQEGNLIVLFPEGRLPACGHSLPIADGTAELVKKLAIPVYTVTGNGAYLTFPKWAKCKRRGKIRVTCEQLFSGEDLKALPTEEVARRMQAALAHDDEAAMRGQVYRTRDTTRGLDGLLRRCPVCGKYGTLSCRRGHIVCTCGMDATLDTAWRLHGAPFESVNAWFDWQQREMDLSQPLTDRVEVETIDDAGRMRRGAGEGVATLDRDAFSFSGEVFGEPVSFSVPTSLLGGIPITVAKHFDIYYENRLFRLYPLTEPRDAILWTSYLDCLHDTASPGDDRKEEPHVESNSL